MQIPKPKTKIFRTFLELLKASYLFFLVLFYICYKKGYSSRSSIFLYFIQSYLLYTMITITSYLFFLTGFLIGTIVIYLGLLKIELI